MRPLPMLPKRAAPVRRSGLCRVMAAAVLAAVVLSVPVMSIPTLARAAEPARQLVVVTSFPPSFFKVFKSAFESRHPDIKVFFRSKKTTSAISFIEERAGEPADLFWASSPDAFELLKQAGQLKPAFAGQSGVRARIGAYPIDDPDGYYKGFAVSGYGLAWNPNYLARFGLEPPASWRDLARPSFEGHIGISSPSRSGTTHLIIESVLQSEGWARGWATLLEIGGNLATVTARSFSVIDGVLSERFGVGVTIDFLAQSAKATGEPIEFAYPRQSTFLPASIAIVKRVTDPEAARTFVDFLLSEDGQKLLLKPEISRLPVLASAYRFAPPHYANPFDGGVETETGAFGIDVSRQRYHLVNSLFDVMITFRQQALRRAWRVIHEAEAILVTRPDPVLAARIAEARALICEVPVTAAAAADPRVTGAFVRHKPGIAVPEEQIRSEGEWVAFARDRQAQAYAIASAVLADLRR